MVLLDVPFVEKDHAKSLGARWDAVSKRWYIPDNFDGDQDVFSRWISNTKEISAASSTGQISFGLDSETQQTDPDKGRKLSEVLFSVQNSLRQSFPGAVWVIAEVTNLNTRRGHVYLELSETNEQGQVIASCRAMIWQSQAERLLTGFATETGSELNSGQKVLLLAEVNFHAQYGFSLVIQDLDPSYTLGELEQKLNEIRHKLIKKGIYQNNKQLTLPADFFRIAVIAPPEAAGLGDFRADADLLQKNNLCEFKYFYSTFQGEATEPELKAALDAVMSLHQTMPYDVLVIIRGGGAKLDLSHLNIESISEALCNLPLPVMTGIGHERDNTILDEVANTRFDTPSKVIGYIQSQIVSQARAAQQNWSTIEKSSQILIQGISNKINQLQSSVINNSQALTYKWQKRLEPINSEISRLAQTRVNRINQELDVTKQKINASVKQKMEVAQIELEQLNSTINERTFRTIEMQRQQIIQSISFILSSGPKSQLNRGFSITKDSDGKPITTAKDAAKQKTVEIEFTDGSIRADIQK